MADLNAYFKSIIDQDREAVVICDLDHTILYMNHAAVVDYGKYGGAALLGKSLLACHNPHSVEAIRKVVDWFAADAGHNIVYTYYNPKHVRDVYMVALRDEDGQMYDAVAGTFLVVGLGEEDFASLSPELAQKYEKQFHQPETFLKLGNRLLVIPVPDDAVKSAENKVMIKPPAEHDR